MFATDPEVLRVAGEWVLDFPKTHNGDYAAVTLTEARNAVKIARRVRRQIRKRLPQAALRSS